MKKAHAIAFAGMFLAVAASGQGTVEFSNYFGNPATDPAIYFYDGVTRVSGPQYLVGLLGGPSAGTMTLCATTTFLTQPGGAGFFVDGVVSIPGVPGGATAWLQLIIWDSTLNGTTTGATFAQAMAYAQGAGLADMYGTSALFRNPTGDPSATPPELPQNLTGLSPFDLVYVPEPETLELGGVGAAAFMFLRQRRRRATARAR